MQEIEEGNTEQPFSGQIVERLDRIEAVLEGREKPLSFEEAADYLDLSKSWLYKLTARDAVPHYKPFGRKIYFLKAELDDFIRAGKQD